MKKIWQALLLLVLGIGGVTAAEVTDLIPQGADGAIWLRNERLYGHPALQSLMASGDISGFRDELQLFRFNAAGTLPDVVVALFGAQRTGVVLAAMEYSPEQLAAWLKQRYAAAKNVQVKQYRQADKPVVELVFQRPQKADKSYYVVYLAGDVVLLAGNKNPVPWTVLNGQYDEALGRQLAAIGRDDLIFGVSNRPSGMNFDPLGLTRQMDRLTFRVGSAENGQGLNAEALAAFQDEKAALNAEKQAQMLTTILLVALLGQQPELFRAVNGSLQFQQEDAGLKVTGKLSAEDLRRLRNLYERDPELGDKLKTLPGNPVRQ